MSLPFAEVTFLDHPKRGQRQPQEVLIRQREYHHDVAVVSIDFETKVQDRYKHGAPVTVRWGWLPDDVEYFHGYVHHTTTHDLHGRRKRLDIYCVGASYRMKEIRLRSFKKKTAHQIAAIICKDHHFSLTAECHHFVHQHVTQHGRSDWDFLVWLAKRIGYTIYATKTDVVLAKRVIDRRPSRARPTFVYRPALYRQRGACYKLTHKVGENVPGTSKKKLVLQGVDDHGKKIKAVHKAPLCHTHGTTKPTKPVFHKKVIKPVHHKAHADALLAGEADLHRFHIIGHGELSGNTKVHQGSTIRIAGIDTESDGYWYVGMVDHHITLTDYRMKVELGRDALGDPDSPTVSGTDADPITSDSDKPVLFTDCDISVGDDLTPAPEPIYDPVDDCVPITGEDADEDDGIQGPLDTPPLAPNASPARRRKAAKKPKPKRRRRTCAPVKTQKKPKRKKAKINGWRAKHHVVRVKGPC